MRPPGKFMPFTCHECGHHNAKEPMHFRNKWLCGQCGTFRGEQSEQDIRREILNVLDCALREADDMAAQGFPLPEWAQYARALFARYGEQD